MASPQHRYTLTRPLVLIGLMGAGKSTVGIRLANTLGVPFRDSDHEIEEAAACSISDLFAIYGEEIFRDLEKKVIRRLLQEPNQIIATGGGAYIQPAVKKEIQKNAFTVWLRADLPVLLERVNRRDTRPLLAGKDKQHILKKLMEERYPAYEQADLVVDSNEGPHEEVVRRIMKELKKTDYGILRRA